ncbi:unnamed protein product [Pylaiella littoralis]
MSVLSAACRTASTSIRQRSGAPVPSGSFLRNHAHQQRRQHQHQHQQLEQQLQQHQQRGMASNRGERLTVHQKKKTSRALVRARRVRNASIVTVLDGEEWAGYEGTVRQGLRELDDTTEVKRQGTHASKPLVSAAAHGDEDEDGDRLSQRDAWAERMEGVWNEVLQADSRGSKPRVTLPGFPVHVVMVKIARDYGHHKIFWELSEVDTRPPDSTLRQLYQARQRGFSARAVVLKSTAERLRRGEGYLRASLARRVPMRVSATLAGILDIQFTILWCACTEPMNVPLVCRLCDEQAACPSAVSASGLSSARRSVLLIVDSSHLANHHGLYRPWSQKVPSPGKIRKTRKK